MENRLSDASKLDIDGVKENAVTPTSKQKCFCNHAVEEINLVVSLSRISSKKVIPLNYTNKSLLLTT